MNASKAAAVLIPETTAPAETPKTRRAGVVVELVVDRDKTVPGKDQEYLERMGRWHQRRHRRKHRLGYLGR
jgi:hypothetical protein